MSGSAAAGDRPMIEIVGFRKWYGDVEILRGVDLAVPEGETLVVVGGSGCGKSTLLRHVAGIENGTSGEISGRIRVDDVDDIARIPERELMRRKLRGPKIGLQFQAGALFDTLTVFENIAWPLRETLGLRGDAVDARVREVVQMVEMSRVPGVLDKRPAQLSGGQQRRIALARAIALEPHVMLYDEPTAGLDPPVAIGIARLIRRLQRDRGLTAIVATHDMAAAQVTADRLAMMEGGRVVFWGSFERAQADAHVRRFIEGGLERAVAGDSGRALRSSEEVPDEQPV